VARGQQQLPDAGQPFIREGAILGIGLDQAAEHVAGQHGAAGDGHRAKPVDDALGHVLRDGDRRALRRGGYGQQDDRRGDVVGVRGAAAV